MSARGVSGSDERCCHFSERASSLVILWRPDHIEMREALADPLIERDDTSIQTPLSVIQRLFIRISGVYVCETVSQGNIIIIVPSAEDRAGMFILRPL